MSKSSLTDGWLFYFFLSHVWCSARRWMRSYDQGWDKHFGFETKIKIWLEWGWQGKRMTATKECMQREMEKDADSRLQVRLEEAGQDRSQSSFHSGWRSVNHGSLEAIRHSNGTQVICLHNNRSQLSTIKAPYVKKYTATVWLLGRYYSKLDMLHGYYWQRWIYAVSQSVNNGNVKQPNTSPTVNWLEYSLHKQKCISNCREWLTCTITAPDQQYYSAIILSVNGFKVSSNETSATTRHSNVGKQKYTQRHMNWNKTVKHGRRITAINASVSLQ